MSRLIDADALIDKHGDWYTEEGTEEGYIGTIKDIVESMPTIEERAKGRWILDQKSGRRICSECLAVAARDDFGNEYLSDYCTVCGVDMRGVPS